MAIHVQVGDEVLKGKGRPVYVNNEPSHHTPSHHIEEDRLHDVLNTARLQGWKSQPQQGQRLGRELYKLLNGSGGKLQELIQKSRAQGDSLHLYIDLPFALDALPVDLLHDEHFLALESDTHIIRGVTDRNRLKKTEPEERAVTMLFVACSPIDLSRSTLQFEKEEESIIREVDRFQFDMTLEDSGSLEGLHDAMIEANGFDVVHITGHAGHDADGPVFYMEDEFGRLDKVTPKRLCEVLLDYTPRLLFLSGCSTGKADKVHEVESFAHQLVADGVPMVLGWGLPVSDVGATVLTVELYKHLAQGKSVDFSVRRSRQFVSDKYHPWPLLRLSSRNNFPVATLAKATRLAESADRT